MYLLLILDNEKIWPYYLTKEESETQKSDLKKGLSGKKTLMVM
jgi:hypothetical protein